jgi:predicted acyltransferase
VIDLRGWNRWAFPLVVIGVNALAAYMLNTIVPLRVIVGTFTRPLVPGLGILGPVLGRVRSCSRDG